MKPLVCLTAFLTLIHWSAAPAAAQLPGVGLSAGVQFARPLGGFDAAANTGYGAYAAVRISAVVIGAEGRVEAIRFSGDDPMTVLGARVGPRIGAGPIKFGFDIGRYSEIDRTGYTPNLSVGLGPLEATAGMTFFSGGRWLALSGGLRF
jgi:hypothetical protein